MALELQLADDAGDDESEAYAAAAADVVDVAVAAVPAGGVVVLD